MKKLKIFNIALVCGLISAIFISMLSFTEACQEMYDSIIRIRIIANSDSDFDQNLKLSVRDAVLDASKTVYTDVSSYDDAVKLTSDNTDHLLNAAENVLLQRGAGYNVTVDIREEFFSTRVYDDFTLPAGNYKTAVFTLGEGKGENWWCVIYPTVCVGACSESLDKTLSKESSDIAYNPEKYVIKFKTVEVFEKIKKYFDF
ncbi:MAG: stage II sporulation protein R [Acutalibacteraceae bacterium]|nr:stage II sporulation protein R [Acutalibacteraceae bacterium]